MERRQFETRVTADGGKIVGLASPCYDGSAGSEYHLFDNTYERFAPGAFDAHLASNPDVVGLFNHNPDHVLGRTSAGTLQLRADAKGLHYVIDPPDTQVARDLKVSMARGDIKGSSFAFVPDDVAWQRDGSKDIRLIRSAKLFDVSVVTQPAYGSSNCKLRAEDRAALEQERNKWESDLRFAQYEKMMASTR